MLSGHTQVAGVIGDPIAHSLSPAIHNAAFAALGLDWVHVAFPTPAGSAPAAVDSVRALGIRGLSVTMPHKDAVIPALDDLSEDARLLGAVNCITRRGDRLVGDSTDGDGFVAGVRDDFDLDPAGLDCVVLGAGGAARSVVLALARAGARSVGVVNRSADPAARAAALAGPVGRVATVEEIADAALVVQATPVGMGASGDQEWPVEPALLGAGQVLAELVYHPLETPLMRAAAERGCRTANGVSMLVHQAAIAFSSWTGEAAPLTAMRSAVGAALG
ncbi:MAG: shikimate dehydrogenase [Microthrixaceae bacterium]